MHSVYMVVRHGVYIRGIHGVFTGKEDAINRADELAEKEIDDYHEFEVYIIPINHTPKIVDYDSGYLYDKPIYTVRKKYERI